MCLASKVYRKTFITIPKVKLYPVDLIVKSTIFTGEKLNHLLVKKLNHPATTQKFNKWVLVRENKSQNITKSHNLTKHACDIFYLKVIHTHTCMQ